MPNRPGFIIPNSANVGGVFRLAEPDSGDFIILGNSRYGVVAGCNVSIPTESSGTASITGGADGNVLLVDGELLFVADQVVNLLAASATRDRFDLLVYDGVQRRFTVLEGVPSSSPTFPDIPANVVPLTSIFVPAGASGISSAHCVDKRKFLQRSFQGSVAAGDPLIANLTAAGASPYVVKGDGRTEWTDVSLERSSSQTLKVNGYLNVARTLTATQGIKSGGSIEATGRVSGENLRYGIAAPASATGDVIGSFYVRTTDGATYVRRAFGWAELDTDKNPPGTIMDSILEPTSPYLVGWLPMNGATYARSDVGRLWDEPSCADWRNLGSQTMTLPNLDKKFRMPDASAATGSLQGSSSKTLAIGNLPPHSHFSSTVTPQPGDTPEGRDRTGLSGGHTHVATAGAAGSHTHNIDDGHWHGNPVGSAGYLVLAVPGNNSQYVGLEIQGPGPSNVAVASFTNNLKTGANTSPRITADPSANHTHPVVFQMGGEHSHTLPNEASVGGGSPLDVTPAHLVVRTYIKV